MNLLGGRALLRMVLGYSPDIVISTDARLNAVLGQLKRSGKLDVVTFATLTDLSGLEFWTHKGIDLHLVMDSNCLASVERVAGAGAAYQVRPLVAPQFFTPLSREAAREQLDLPQSGRIVLVSGGGWGIGDTEGAVRAILAVPETYAVCITGKNEAAKAEMMNLFPGEPRVIVVGYTTQMNELMAACDVVIHATAGVTYLEALVRGRPVIAYRPPPGHPALIASVLAERGEQVLALTQGELARALEQTLSQPEPADDQKVSVPSAASTILSAPRRVSPRPVWQRIAIRATAVAVLVALMGAYAFLGDEPYTVMASVLRLHGATPTIQSTATLPVVIEVSAATLPRVLADLQNRHETASFALQKGWTEKEVLEVGATGSEVLPLLRSTSLINWIHTRSALSKQAAELGVDKLSVYLPPKDGLTLSEYLLARSSGAVPVRGGKYMKAGNSNTEISLHGDKLLILDLDTDEATSIKFLDRVIAELQDEGLAMSPLELKSTTATGTP
jgi:processive 1,2-diacylglycerol beta-glucosyltransferase